MSIVHQDVARLLAQVGILRPGRQARLGWVGRTAWKERFEVDDAY
jgi:hypothetical protein